MKIAVLTSGILPVPAVLGGAVENLIDFYLEYNEIHQLHDITVYSVSHSKTKNLLTKKSNYNHYYYIDVNSLWAKIKRKLYFYLHGEEYHHYFIEYFLEQSIKHIRKQNYDCIILENRPSYALKLKSITNAKLIYHLHNEKLTKLTPAYQEIYDAASNIICVSDFIKNSVKSINPNDTKCITVYNGIDLRAFSAKHSHITRQDVGLNNQDFVLIYSGRINQEKGIKELTEAMNELLDYPKIKLLVIGSSFFGNVTDDDIFSKELRESTKNIQDKIFFTGFIPYKDVPSYLKLADLAIVPSMWDEAFGLTVLEAMAAGLPLITTRSGGIPEICEDVAYLINRENIVGNLTKTIVNLYNHPEIRTKISSRSFKRAQLFSKEKYAAHFFKALVASPDARQ
jgi:glycosyltransferase involved in cell wall biosynthesis